MYKLIDSRILDINAEKSGIDMEDLMDSAGNAVAEFVMSLKKERILVVCGSGNNGGDGYTAAIRLLNEKKNVAVFSVKSPATYLSKKKRDLYVSSGGKIVQDADMGSYDLIVDAIFGIGISGTPKEPYLSIIKRINTADATVVAVDVPSGFLTGTMVKADYTVTMQFKKEGMNKRNCGNIVVKDVGFPKEVIEMIGPGELLSFPGNEKNSRKGDNGVVVIVSGSQEFYGASVYVSKSALRMGPDLVFLFAPQNIHCQVASQISDIILRRSGNDYIEYSLELSELIGKKADAVAIGPGISKNDGAQEGANSIIEFSLRQRKNIVIDADALSAIRGIDDFMGLAVLTPHRGEFKAAFNLEPNEENAKKIASKLNAVIFLKGPVDIVTDGKIVKKNSIFHHSSMTRGGTGDLITGAVAGLLSRKVDPLHSAALASYVVGKAGLIAFKKKGYSYLTSELLDFIPDVTNELSKE